MTDIEDVEDFVESKVSDLARYVQDNPLATIAGVMILGMLLARFAFLGNAQSGRKLS